MNISWLKHRISYVFLVIFLTMKLAGLHALLHTDHPDDSHAIHCLICDQAVINNATPLLTPVVLESNSPHLEKTRAIKLNAVYLVSLCKTIPANQLFSRPPPIL